MHILYADTCTHTHMLTHTVYDQGYRVMPGPPSTHTCSSHPDRTPTCPDSAPVYELTDRSSICDLQRSSHCTWTTFYSSSGGAMLPSSRIGVGVMDKIYVKNTGGHWEGCVFLGSFRSFLSVSILLHTYTAKTLHLISWFWLLLGS